jgi:hypothetical protein
LHAPKSDWLTPSQQWWRLRASPIANGNGRVQRRSLVWTFAARPSVWGREYKIQLRLAQPASLDVLVLAPDLNRLAEGRPLPHVYSSDPVKLCLFDPAASEWTPRDALADTIVPWTYLWLLYFEEWLISNEWKGGGRHPGERHAA